MMALYSLASALYATVWIKLHKLLMSVTMIVIIAYQTHMVCLHRVPTSLSR